MVNGLCHSLPTRSYDYGSLCGDIIPYLCSLRAFHGFDTIYVRPRQRFSAVYPSPYLDSNIVRSDEQKAVDGLYKRLQELSFVKFIPGNVWSYSETRRTILAKLIREFLESVGMSPAVYDLDELRLSDIVNLYQIWVASCELQAETICSSPGRFAMPLGLVDAGGGIRDQMELRPLRISLKRWFFSHCANFDVKLPTVIGEMHEDLQEPLFVKEFRKTRHLLSLPKLRKTASTFRDELLSKSKKYSYRISSYAKKNVRGIGVFSTSCAITVATRNLYSLSPALLEVPYLAKHFCNDILHKEFDSHLVLEAPSYFTAFNAERILRDAQILFLEDVNKERTKGY